MGEAEHDAEPAGDLLQVADRFDQVVRRAHHRSAAAVGAASGDLLHEVPRFLDAHRTGAAEHVHVVLVVPPVQSVHRLVAGLLAGLGDVPAHHHAPVLAVDGPAVLRRRLLGKAPLGGQRSDALGGGGGDRQHAHAVFAGELHARRRDARRDRHRHLLLQRQQLECGVVEREPLAVVGESVLAGEEARDHRERLVLAVALHHWVDAEGAGIARERARAAAEHRTTAGHVIELHHALGDVERVVVGERDDARAEADVMGLLAGGSQEHLRRGDHLPAARVVLATPELLEAESVEMRRELDVALELEHRVLAQRVVRGDEGAELETSHDRHPRKAHVLSGH